MIHRPGNKNARIEELIAVILAAQTELGAPYETLATDEQVAYARARGEKPADPPEPR